MTTIVTAARSIIFTRIYLVFFCLFWGKFILDAQEIPPSVGGQIVAVNKDNDKALIIGASNGFALLNLQTHDLSGKPLVSYDELRITSPSAGIAEEQRRYLGGYFFRSNRPFAIVTRSQAMVWGQAELWDLGKTNFICKIGNTLKDVRKITMNNPNAGLEVFTTNLFPGKINQCLIAPDDRTLVVCSGDLGADLNMDSGLTSWDLNTGQCLHWYQGVRGAVFDIAISPDGSKLVGCGFDNDVRLWDAHTAKLIATLPDDLPRAGTTGDFLHLVALSPDGKYAAAIYGTYSVSLLLWDLRTRQLLNHLPSIGMATDLKFSPNATKIAVANVGSVTVYSVPKLTKCDSMSSGTGRFVSQVSFLNNKVLVCSGPDPKIHWFSIKN